MSPHDMNIVNLVSGFPRVSGDEPPILDSTEVYSGFSPRERG